MGNISMYILDRRGLRVLNNAIPLPDWLRERVLQLGDL